MVTSDSELMPTVILKADPKRVSFKGIVTLNQTRAHQFLNLSDQGNGDGANFVKGRVDLKLIKEVDISIIN